MRANYEGDKLSPPSLIADTIVTASTAKKPKTRYLTGYMAKPAVFMRGSDERSGVRQVHSVSELITAQYRNHMASLQRRTGDEKGCFRHWREQPFFPRTGFCFWYGFWLKAIIVLEKVLSFPRAAVFTSAASISFRWDFHQFCAVGPDDSAAYGAVWIGRFHHGAISGHLSCVCLTHILSAPQVLGGRFL